MIWWPGLLHACILKNKRLDFQNLLQFSFIQFKLSINTDNTYNHGPKFLPYDTFLHNIEIIK